MNAEMTPFVPTRDDLIGYISDTYKEINGFRPRGDWDRLSYEHLDKWGQELSEEVIRHRKEEVVRLRLQRKRQRAAHRAWVIKKAEILKPKPIGWITLPELVLV
jgi:hypothetical protein